MVKLDLTYGMSSEAREIVETLLARGGGRLYLVGGFLRDLLLGRASYDMDFLYLGDPLEILGDMDRPFFPLDVPRGIYRMMWGRYQVDVAAPRALSLEEDLRERDFTVNAMAYSLTRKELLDPWGGVEDLEARRLRAVTPWAFREDPLRVLRAFRISSHLSFTATQDTLELAARAAPLLSQVAKERIKEEFSLILAHPRSAEVFKSMAREGILGVIYPEVEEGRGILQGKWLGTDLKGHLLGTLYSLERIIPFLQDFFPSYHSSLRTVLAEEVEGGYSRLKVLKLAALLHDIGKPSTMAKRGEDLTFWGHDRKGGERVRSLGGRLGLGVRASALLASLVSHHMWLHLLARQGEVTSRARGRFFRRLGKEGVVVILLSLADALASSGEWGFYLLLPLAREMLEFYYSRFLVDERLRRPLLSGYEVMELLSLEPGPEVGELLRALVEAQSEGKVTSKEEARKFLEELRQRCG